MNFYSFSKYNLHLCFIPYSKMDPQKWSAQIFIYATEEEGLLQWTSPTTTALDAADHQ